MTVQEIVEQIQIKKENGIKEIFLVACGGSLVDMYLSKYFLENEAKELKVFLYTSNEFAHVVPKSLGKDSLVVLCSHGGSTKETVQAAKIAKENGAATIGLTFNKEGELLKHSDHSILYQWGEDTNVKDNPMAIIFAIVVEAMKLNEGFEAYEKIQKGLEMVNGIIVRAGELVEKRAEQFAEKYQNEKMFYVMSSGASYGHAYGFSICSLMEMQWMHASAIHSGEYFHGPFEVTDKETPYILLMNEGRTRALDERALTFLQKYAEKVEVVDCKELGINTIDDEVVEYFNPIVFYSILSIYRAKLAERRQHPLETRRYMGKVAY